MGRRRTFSGFKRHGGRRFCLTTTIQLRRGTAAQWTSANPVLASGEVGLETDTGLFKIGNGSAVWAARPYGGIHGAQGPAGNNGADGADGNDGAQGPRGDPGANGNDGAPGPQGPQGPAGASMLCVPLVADSAAITLTNMALALNFFNASHRFALKADLTNFTQVRLIVNKQGTAGAAASKIILRYITAFNTTPANWLDIGTSEVNCAINVQNTVLASAWINLAASAKADVFICPLMSGGDGALDPVVGSISAQFK